MRMNWRAAQGRPAQRQVSAQSALRSLHTNTRHPREGGDPTGLSSSRRRCVRGEVSWKHYPSVRRQWKCAKCHQEFCVGSNRIFEGAHAPVGKLIYATYVMCAHWEV